MKLRSISLFFFVAYITQAYCQDTVVINNSMYQDIEMSLEEIFEQSEEDFQFDIYEDMQKLKEDPININKATREDLQKIYYLNHQQISKLIEYKNEFGALLSYQELYAVEGFDHNTIQNILPYIFLKDNYSEGIMHKQKKLKGSFLMRYSRNFYEDNSYFKDYSKKSSLASLYLGSPDKLLLKFQTELKNNIAIGFLSEKDAGEPMFRNNFPDTIKNLLHKKFSSGFDYYSAYIMLNKVAFIKRIVVGDFHLNFGQGMTIWSSGFWNSISEPTHFIRNGTGLRPNTSMNENNFFRGVACTVSFRNIDISGFFSSTNRDATLSVLVDSDNDYKIFSAFKNTGYHRTINEINSRNSIKLVQYGSNLGMYLNSGKIGVSIIKSSFSENYKKDNSPVYRYSFQGRSIINTGIDWVFQVFKKLSFNGEITFSNFRNIAFTTGIYSYLSPIFQVSIAYQYFSPRYFSITSNSGRRSNNLEESNITIAISLQSFRKCVMNGSVRLTRFNWIKYHVDAPSVYLSYIISTRCIPSENALLSLSFRQNEYGQNYNSGFSYTNRVEEVKRQTYQLMFCYTLSERIILKSRLIHCQVFLEQNKSGNSGNIFSQEISYTHSNNKLNCVLSLAIFDTDNYDSRIYVYEKNVLYSFTIPSFSGSGIRSYFLVKLKILRKLDSWFRVSKTLYLRKEKSTNTEEYFSNEQKMGVSLQLRLKI